MKYLPILILVLALNACRQHSPMPIKKCIDYALRTGDVVSPEEYAIIEAILTEYHSDQNFVHIRQESNDGGRADIIFDYLDWYAISFDSSTVEAYETKNSSYIYWKDQFKPSVKLFPLEEWRCLFRDNDYAWDSYYAKYEQSNGFFRFARPAINSNNEAILEYSRSCNNLCGYNYMVILEKQSGSWKVMHRILTSIS